MRGLCVLAALLALAGCGRYGPPRPPGPAEQVTHPRAYPQPTAAERAAEAERLRRAGLPVPPSLPR